MWSPTIECHMSHVFLMPVVLANILVHEFHDCLIHFYSNLLALGSLSSTNQRIKVEVEEVQQNNNKYAPPNFHGRQSIYYIVDRCQKQKLCSIQTINCKISWPLLFQTQKLVEFSSSGRAPPKLNHHGLSFKYVTIYHALHLPPSHDSYQYS